MSTEAKMLNELTDEVRAALDQYHAIVQKFRGEVKNDLASAKSAADNIESNVHKMGKAYAATAAMLTSPQFEAATVNAERMAVALAAISQVQDNKISFAVIADKPA